VYTTSRENENNNNNIGVGAFPMVKAGVLLDGLLPDQILWEK
jgi:hypothetical protein